MAACDVTLLATGSTPTTGVVSAAAKSEEYFLTWLSQPDTRSWLESVTTATSTSTSSAPSSQRQQTSAHRRLRDDESDNDVDMPRSLADTTTRLCRHAAVALLRHECGLPRAAASLVYTRLSDAAPGSHSTPDISIARLRTDFADIWNQTSRQAALWATLIAARSPRRRAQQHMTSDVLLPEDLRALVLDVVTRHPSLRVLRDIGGAVVPRFADMVVARIVRASGTAIGSGRINQRGLARSPLLRTLDELDESPNAPSHELFAAADFFVAFGAFWELDEDGDSLLTPADIQRYNSLPLSPVAAVRVASIHPIPLALQQRLRRATTTTKLSPSSPPASSTTSAMMTFSDFVFFLLSQEDPSHADSLAYWFNVIDTDCDGVLSTFEMERFYNGVRVVLENDGMTCPPFEHVARELCDMIGMPGTRSVVALSLMDIRKSGHGRAFFGSLICPGTFAQSSVGSTCIVPTTAPRNGNAPAAVTGDWVSFVERQSIAVNGCDFLAVSQPPRHSHPTSTIVPMDISSDNDE